PFIIRIRPSGSNSSTRTAIRSRMRRSWRSRRLRQSAQGPVAPQSGIKAPMSRSRQGRHNLTASLSRFVGFAFASADLLIEIDRGGRIAFAAGAGEALSGASESQFVGRLWRDFISAGDQPMVEAFFRSMEDGARGGPLLVRLAGAADATPRGASLSAFRLPQNEGAVSCVFSRAVAPTGPEGGLYDRAAFEHVTATLFQTAKANGLDLELALLELGGFSDLRE